MTDRAKRAHVWGLCAAAILIGLGVLHVWSLLRFPAPFVDEAWIASRGWAFVTHGEMIGTLDRGLIDHFPQGWTFFPVLPTLADALALALAGAPSVRAVRLVSLAGGAVLGCAIWSIARRLVDARAAFLAVVLLALSSTFVYSSHLARPDVLAAALGYSGVALFLAAGRERPGLAGLGGLSVSLALDVHPFAVVIAAALPVLAVAEFGVRLQRFAVCRAMLAGLALGAAVWVVVHVLPDVRGYFAITRVLFGSTHPPFVWREWLQGPFDLLLLLWAAYFLALPVVAWALVSLLGSPRTGDRRVGIVAVTVCAAFAVLVRNKLPYYAILITPASTVCLAAALVRTYDDRRRRPALAVAWLTVSALLLVRSLSSSLGVVASDRFATYERVQARLGASVRPGDRIMGTQTYWFGLHEHPYFSWEQLVFLQRLRPGTTLADALRTMRPDVFIRDEHTDNFIIDSPGPTPYTRVFRVAKSEFESWLHLHATVVDDFDGGGHGRVRVYRLKWLD